MGERINIPSNAPATVEGLAQWVRTAAGSLNTFLQQAAESDPFFVKRTDCLAPPTNTTIAGASEIVFVSPFVGNGILILTGVGFEGGVTIAVNDVNLGTLSDPDITSEILYEVAVTNLIEGFNTLKIWSTTSDTGELRRVEAWRNFAKSQIDAAGGTAIWGSITGAGKPADNADVTAANTAAAIAGQGALATKTTADFGSDVSGTKPPADATRNAVSSGTVTPTGGANGDLYFETDAQAWWSRIAGVWQKVSDATAANIAAGIAGQGALATKSAVDLATAEVLNKTLANVADTATRFAAAEAGANKTETRVAHPVNARFEAGDSGWQIGAGWAIINDPANARAGNWVGKFDGTTQFLRNQVAPGTPGGFPASEGNRFLIGGWVKTSADAAFASAGWRLSWRTAAGAENGFKFASIFAPNTTYAEVRAVGVAPAGTAFAVLEGSTSGRTAGTIYIDDGFLVPIPKDSDIDALATANGPAEAGATLGADWASNVTTRPVELTDGRVAASILSATLLASGVLKDDGSGIARAVGIGIGDQEVFDGVAVTFTQAWQAIPTIIFGGGGVVNDSSLTPPYELRFAALNVSTSGFTPSLRLGEISGTQTDVTDSTVGTFGTDPTERIEKSATLESLNDTYVFRYSTSNTSSPNNTAEIGFFTRTLAGSAWVQRGTDFKTTNGTFNKNIAVDGLGADAAFGISQLDGASGATVTFINVTYTTQTGAMDVSATPAGAQGVTATVIGNSTGI